MSLLASEGCSLLAPSRDELSGGKNSVSADAQVPDSNEGSAGSGGTSSIEDGSSEDGSSEAPEVSMGDDAEPPIDGAPDAGDAARDAIVNVLSCDNLGSLGQWQLTTPKDVSVT